MTIHYGFHDMIKMIRGQVDLAADKEGMNQTINGYLRQNHSHARAFDTAYSKPFE